MHGATAVAKINRRAGIPATIKGRPNPDHPRTLEGVPTPERLAKSGRHFHVGEGTRVYQFCDAPLDRIYSRLLKSNRTEHDLLRMEYAALQKFRLHWHRAGKESTTASVDLNGIFASDPSHRQGMPMAESQVHHNKQWRSAREFLGHKPQIVVENIVCAETSLEMAGWAIGSFTSRTSARDGAERILRESARKLAKLWGIS
jgi:hypothetical protein